MSNEIEVRSREGFETIAKYLPADFEELARQHKVLETQYGEAKIKTADDLLRLILLHAGADLGLRQTVTLMAEAKGPAVSHVTLHKKMRLSAGYLRALVDRLTRGQETAPESWAGYDVVVVDGSSFSGPGAEGTDARLHLQLRLSGLEILKGARLILMVGCIEFASNGVAHLRSLLDDLHPAKVTMLRNTTYVRPERVGYKCPPAVPAIALL